MKPQKTFELLQISKCCDFILRSHNDLGFYLPTTVFVTSNFHRTVRRVEKALSAIDAWLLVAPTDGINVWCSSAGGEMTAHNLLTVMKTSRVQDRVAHRRLILPQLSAPGIDRKLLKKPSG